MGQMTLTIYKENKNEYQHHFCAENTPDFTGVKYL